MKKKLYDLMNWPDIEGIIYADGVHPKNLLGAHSVKGEILIQAFYPGAVSATIKYGTKELKMEMADEEGYFAALVPVKNKFDYSILYKFADKSTLEIKDGANAPSIIKKSEIKAFTEGNCSDAYKFLGAHPVNYKGEQGINFAVWAPNALRVSVVGSFNNWDGRANQMELNEDTGIFEVFVPNAKPGDMYKYELKLKGGKIIMKADPYGFSTNLGENSDSIVYSDEFKWEDADWMTGRNKDSLISSPVSIYEVHLGSFKRKDGKPLNYREISPLLKEYVHKQGYTHVELMPVMEHYSDESLGYEITGFYSPTCRYGTPDDFKFLINDLHMAGIGVILDWVPAYFPKNEESLITFDGTPLYEYKDKKKSENSDGNLMFNYSRNEVSDFLISNGMFWAKEYHADGLRMESLASMLYLDYGKEPGEWVPNMYGGKENLDAISFLKKFMAAFEKECSDVLLIAEELTMWSKVTKKTEDSLGFDYKWNKGFNEDLLYFMACDPLFRKGRYGKLSLSMVYAYAENFILAISHNEVSSGEKSMLNKMPGRSIKEKISNLRVLFGYIYTHPGKKLTFMGQDFAMEKEWKYDEEIEWDVLLDNQYADFWKYTADLNKLYKAEPALFAKDYDTEGFEWINNISGDECILTFMRKASEEDMLLVVANFTPVERTRYKIGVPKEGKYKEIFNSDNIIYGGSGFVNARAVSSKLDECDGRNNSIRITVPPMGISILRYQDPTVKTVKKAKK